MNLSVLLGLILMGSAFLVLATMLFAERPQSRGRLFAVALIMLALVIWVYTADLLWKCSQGRPISPAQLRPNTGFVVIAAAPVEELDLWGKWLVAVREEENKKSDTLVVVFPSKPAHHFRTPEYPADRTSGDWWNPTPLSPDTASIRP